MALWNSTHDRFLVGLMLATLCVALCGCGDAGPRRVPVAGTVTVDGNLLEKGTIQFSPVDNSGPMVAVTVSPLLPSMVTGPGWPLNKVPAGPLQMYAAAPATG